jgi:hypothetical protein
MDQPGQGKVRWRYTLSEMSERKGYVHWHSHEHSVTWHTISGEVYVYWGDWCYAGKASSMQGALDTALSWLNVHAR